MNASPRIAIVDYGVSNIHSAFKAFRRFTDRVTMTEESKDIFAADALVLPGVGAFRAGMEGLAIRGLVPVVKEFAASGRPVLGICLGAQIMLETGYEFGVHEGLGLMEGDVAAFEDLKPGTKVPHMGWNAIFPPEGTSWEDTILSRFPKGGAVYFVHSFILRPSEPSQVLALAEHGGRKFCAVVRKGRIVGCQFHPEKSGQDGLKIIEEFVRSI